MTKPILLLLAAFALPSHADTLYKCQNTEGKTTYTNQKGGKNCEIVAQDKPVSTFSAPPAAKQAKQATPGDFPRVNGDQQKARDNDRRAILEQELANEQKSLDEARKSLSEQESIILPEERGAGGAVYADKREARIRTHRDKMQLHERNLESIRREIANLR